MNDSSTAVNSGLYALSPFSTANPDPTKQTQIAAAATQLAGSGFQTIVFASMHVSTTGDINFNDAKMVSGGQPSTDLDPSLPQLISGMKAAGQTTLASFGGGGCFSGQAIGYWDFTHIQDLIAQYPDPDSNPFFQNLQVMLQTFNIDGVDLDLEVYDSAFTCKDGFAATYSEFQDTLVTMINWLSTNGYAVTIAPYEDASFWAGLLAVTYVNNEQQVSWMNLQSGSTGQIQSFINAMNGVSTGISDPASFISSGLQLGDEGAGMSPSEVQDNYTSIASTYADLEGGWLWNFGSFPSQDIAAQYASAIVDGLTSVTAES